MCAAIALMNNEELNEITAPHLMYSGVHWNASSVPRANDDSWTRRVNALLFDWKEEAHTKRSQNSLYKSVTNELKIYREPVNHESELIVLIDSSHGLQGEDECIRMSDS